MWRRMVLLAGLTIIVILVSLIGYASFMIAHAVRETRDAIGGLSPNDLEIPGVVKDVVLARERRSGEVGTPSSVRAFVASRVAAKQWTSTGDLGWQLRKLPFDYSLLRFNESEILALYLDLLPYEAGRGVAEAS